MGRVTHGKFSYDVDTFYVEASGHPHRRAIPAELRAIFDASIPDRNQRPDHPAHWFEAQLLHYGLSPSKVKATAKMRLLDAIQDGILQVPIELVQMEKRLKKEWKRQDAAACVLSSGHAHSATSGITNTTTTETVTRNTVITSSFIPQKRARDTKDDRFKDRPTVKQTARRVGMGKVSVPSNNPQPTAFQPQERPKPELPNQARQRQASGVPNRPPQTARKTVVGTGSEGHSYESPSTASYSQQIRQIPGPRTVANESSGLSGGIGQVGIRSLAPSHRDGLQTDDDDSDDEYFGDSLDPCDDQFILQSHLASDDLPCRDPFDDRYSFGGLIPLSTRPMTGGFADPRGPPPIFNQLFEAQPPKRRLGPLNGEYDIASDEPTGNLVNSNGTRVDPKICLALNWNEMFGSIKLGILEGTLWIPERPKKASEEKVPFKWYGKVSGQLIGHENSGWIRFLGDGEIEGEISSLRRYSFVGQRISGENTVAVSSVYELRREWFGYVNQVNEALLNGLIG